MTLRTEAAQPDFVYRHEWTPGDLVIRDNLCLRHRVVPHTDQTPTMHRTIIASTGMPGHVARREAHAASAGVGA